MLSWIVVLGICVFFTIEVIRKLPGVWKWALEGKRPWGCDLCMSLWTSVTWSVLMAIIDEIAWRGLLWSVPGAAGVSLMLLYWTASLVPATPPDLP